MKICILEPHVYEFCGIDRHNEIFNIALRLEQDLQLYIKTEFGKPASWRYQGALMLAKIIKRRALNRDDDGIMWCLDRMYMRFPVCDNWPSWNSMKK